MSLRYDLIDLRLFLNIAEAASITHGARRSNMSLAAASERVRAMEHALGAPLLARGRRGIKLMPAGVVLLHHARIVVQQLQQMRGDLDAHAKGLRGHVRLLANTVGLLEYLPVMLSKFLAAQPNIDVELDEERSSEIVRAVAGGRADIGIVAGAIDPAMELESFPFTNNLLVLIMPKRHALAGRRKVAFVETLDYDYVGLGAASALQEFVNQHAERAGSRLKVRVRLSSFDAICQMVEGGTGLAVIPQATARRWQRLMAINIAAFDDAWAVRHLSLCVRSTKSLTPHARRLLAFLREQGGHSKRR